MNESASVILLAAILFEGILVASPLSAVAQEEHSQNTTTTEAITI